MEAIGAERGIAEGRAVMGLLTALGLRRKPGTEHPNGATIRHLRDERAAALTETRRLRRIDVAQLIAQARAEGDESWKRT